MMVYHGLGSNLLAYLTFISVHMAAAVTHSRGLPEWLLGLRRLRRGRAGTETCTGKTSSSGLSRKVREEGKRAEGQRKSLGERRRCHHFSD